MNFESIININGREYPMPGVHPDISIGRYHSLTHIMSNSGLNAMARSPAHFFAQYLDPNRPPREPETAAQLHGHLAHCAILEPAEFDKRYVVGPDVNRNTNAWRAFAESLPKGATAIKPDQREAAMLQARSVGLLPEIANALARGVPEESAFWRDDEVDVPCRCRPDWRAETASGGVILLDVKTFASANPQDFARQAARMGYHRQAAWYSKGYRAASGRAVHGFVFIVVEDKWPFAASAVMLDDDALDQGWRECRALLDLYAECKERSAWPAFGNDVHVVSLPKWAIDN